MTIVYESPDYSYCYRGYDPTQRALRRKGIKAKVFFQHSWSNPPQMRVEVPLGTQVDIVHQVVSTVEKRFPARPYKVPE